MRNKLEIENSVWYDDLTDVSSFVGCVFTEINKSYNFSSGRKRDKKESREILVLNY